MAALCIREAVAGDAEGIARVQVEGWNRAYRSFIPDCLPASYSLERRHEEWRQRLAESPGGKLHLVAVEAGQVLAICSGGPPLRDEMVVEGDVDSYTAQVYGLYVMPERYGEGIGGRLLGDLAVRLAALGHANLCLWAFVRNPFRRFYEKLGGRILARAEWRVGGVTVEEMAYGWPEIAELIQACSAEGKTE